MKKIILDVTGCMGRMGQQIITSLKKDKNFRLTALTENKKINKKINGIKVDLNTEALFKNISNCSGDSFALKNHGLKSIVQDNYPNLAFSVKYAQKDLSYALEMANQMELSTPGSTTINNLFTKAIDEGYGDLYFPVIKKIL